MLEFFNGEAVPESMNLFFDAFLAELLFFIKPFYFLQLYFLGDFFPLQQAIFYDQ